MQNIEREDGKRRFIVGFNNKANAHLSTSVKCKKKSKYPTQSSDDTTKASRYFWEGGFFVGRKASRATNSFTRLVLSKANSKKIVKEG